MRIKKRPPLIFLPNLLRLILAGGGFFVLSALLASTEVGVDSVIHAHLRNNPNLDTLLDHLDEDGVTWLRERTSWTEKLEPRNTPSDARALWKGLKDRGFSIATYTRGVRRTEAKSFPTIDLGIDLLDTYQRAAWMAYSHFDSVDAWELLNEGEHIFVSDLPDRASSWEKAVFLGLKAGASKRMIDDDHPTEAFAQFTPPGYTSDALGAVPVLLGAVAGLPEIRYYEVKADNDFQRYADAWNFHHYGWPSNFAALIESHRSFQATIGIPQPLPLWLTEYGNYRGEIEARQPEAHREQAAYFRSTTQQAIEAQVAVTMPFILRWQGMPGFSLFDPDFNPYLPWEAYIASFKSKKNRGAPPTLFQPPAEVSPLVLQWIADPATADANKHNGAYRFQPETSHAQGWRPIDGTLKLYNFSAQALTGALRWQTSEGFDALLWPESTAGEEPLRALSPGQEITVPAMDVVTLQLRLFAGSASTDHYQKGAFSAQFEARAEAQGRDELFVNRYSGKNQPPEARPITNNPISDNPREAPPITSNLITDNRAASAPPTSLFFPLETRPNWDQLTSLPLEVSETQAPPLRMEKVGSAAVKAQSREELFVNRYSDKNQHPANSETDHPITSNLITDNRAASALPIYIEHDRDPELMRFEDLVEMASRLVTKVASREELFVNRYSGKNQPREARPITNNLVTDNPREARPALARVSVTSRGLLDWHNRDYPYGYEWTSQSGIWSGMNRLVVEDLGVEAGTFARVRLDLKALHPHSQKKPRAVCKVVGGLPADGWLGIIANRTFDPGFNLQVYLIDKWGQRWTIDEQLVSNPHLVSFEKFLKLADFDKTYFGNILPGTTFRPEDVVEIQLHPHGLENKSPPLEIALTILRPR